MVSDRMDAAFPFGFKSLLLREEKTPEMLIFLEKSTNSGFSFAPIIYIIVN